MRAMRVRGLLLAPALIGACGDGGGLAPPPPVVAAGPVEVETDPLRLVIHAPGGDILVDDPIEVATSASVDPIRYYDPRDLDDTLTWAAPARAVGYDAATDALVLEHGVRLTVRDGSVPGTATLALDTEAVGGAVLVRWALPRAVDEPLFGFGENLTSAVAGGDVREMQLRVDLTSESSTNETHVPVPLALWPRRGLGLLIADPRPGAFDIGAARPEQVLATFTLAAPGPLTAHFFTATEPLDLCRTVAALTALPAVPPPWAFAPQQWRNVHQSSDEMRADAHMMRELDIPGSVMWIDNPWQTGYNTFEIDETRFADADALLAEVAALGYQVVVWSTPYVNKAGATAADFDEAAAAGHLVTDDIGRPFLWPWQDGPGALVDFTAAGATTWWRERIARITARGIRGFKLDFGEDLVPELAGNLTPFQLAGGTTQTLHNAYAHGFHAAYLGALPAGDGFLITRAGSYGEQAVNTCIWPGDLDSDFSRHGEDNGEGLRNVGGLPAAVAAGLSLSVSGYPFFGSDIGGFRDGPPSTETLVRWAQVAALGTIMQLGGGGASHNPWDESQFDAEAVPIYRTYARLHMDLWPYLYALAVVAGADGTPVLRPTRFVHPDAQSDDATFFVGESLFVAPVLEESATERTVVLPPGRWIDWWSGAAHDGDGMTARVVPAPLEVLPLWRRANRFVPLFARAADTLIATMDPDVKSYADADFARELRLWITPEAAPATITLHDGAQATSDSDGAAYELTATAGSQFSVFTFDLHVDERAAAAHPALAAPGAISVDGEVLGAALDEAELASCPTPGCWLVEPAAQRLRARVHLADQAGHEIRIE
jgi:alpha-glucosidase (family GH31 glycosyl hydrolase)